MGIFNTLTAAVVPADSVATKGGSSFIDVIKALEGTNHEEIQRFITSLGNDLVHLMANILIAIAIYIIGRWLLKRGLKIMDLAFEKRNLEYSVRSFLKSVVSIITHILLILTIIQILGINTTSLVAMLASAGLAIGMALSGTLQNFAGGVMVLFLKPYKVGDYVTSQGQSGIVKDIMLFTTVLETYDRHTIFVPNSAISSSIIDNATYSNVRRLDWAVAISYGDSVDAAREVILELFAAEEKIIKAEAHTPVVNVVGLGDSSVDLMARAWVKTEDYWDVYFDMFEKIYKTLPERGLHFPFPQMDIHIKEQSK